MGSGLLQPTHVVVLLVIALLVLGPKRLPEVGRSIGEGLKGFKASMEAEDETAHDRRPRVEATARDERPVARDED